MADGIEMPQSTISDHKTYVKIKYRVRVEKGPVLKGAESPELMDFVTGFGHVIPGLEKRLIGHRVGEKLSFTVPPEEGFGQRHDELMIEKSRKDFHFPAGMEPFPGMEIPLVTSSPAAPETALIREVREDSIIIDCNHPLAGAPLQYDLEIVAVRPATDTDVCAEWEEKNSDDACACSPHEFTLGESAD